MQPKYDFPIANFQLFLSKSLRNCNVRLWKADCNKTFSSY